jgi:Flp pilus assembly protein TadG
MVSRARLVSSGWRAKLVREPGATGQILIMFAVMLTALLGAVGLSVDLGMAFSERRTMQSSADAAAYAGTRVVSKAQQANPVSAWSEVQTIVGKNTMAVGTITSIICNYVTDDGWVIAPCTATVPSTATGVEVTVTEQHPTYFIRMVPGAPTNVSTSATARANVKKLGAPTDGPYLPCGVNTRLSSGGTLSLVTQSGGSGWKINPAAVGQTFNIHGPQIEKCKAKASRYKGLADNALNKNLPIPGWFSYKEGDTAGFISTDVEGPDGCKAGQEVVNCVVFLPIVVDSPEEQNNDRRQWAVGYAPFYITANVSGNEHYGKLLADYLVYGKGQDGSWGWQQGYAGPITIRLTK